MTTLLGSRARVAALLALVFLAGAAAGVAGERMWLQRAAAEEAAESDGEGRGTVIERFADDIGLTAEQRERIAPILARSRARFEALWEPLKPRYEALIDSVRAEIEAELTPAQVERYRVILREQEAKERAAQDKDESKATREDAPEEAGSDGSGRTEDEGGS